MTGRIAGEVAVVTGAGAGMGAAVVERFSCEAARFVAVDICGIEREVTERVGSTSVPLHADVSQAAQVCAMLEFATSRFGALDILCNSAGIQGLLQETSDYEEDAYERVMAVNARGVFLGMKYGIRIMLKRGGGTIVNTASMASGVAFPQIVAYRASKGAVLMMTRY